jgi:hypothetical protein
MKNAIYFFLSALTVVVVLSPIFYKSSNGIETYHEDNKYVTASSAVKPKVNAPFMNSMPAKNSDDGAIIGSMIVHKDAAWFLKIKGSYTEAYLQQKNLKQIHQELSFNAKDELQITAPTEWQSKPASGMRYASWTAKGLDISIIRLPAGQDLQGNIIRWKKQIGLPAENATSKELNTIERDGFKIHEILLFNEERYAHSGHNHAPGEGHGSHSGHDHSSHQPPAMAKVAAGSSAIFATIFEREDATWFLKLTGPLEEVQQQADNLIAIIGEHSFSTEGNLTFTKPQDWQTAQGNAMRYASYKSGKIDISVSKLGPKQDLDANVNRWKGQIGISTTSPNERRTFFVKGINVHIVNLKAGQVPTSAPSTPSAVNTTTDLEEFDLPMDKPWVEVSAAKGISMGKYSLTLGEDTYTLSITRMNQLIPMQNIYDMWLSQMNLATGIAPSTQKIACKSGHDFELIRLENESDSLAAATYQGKSMLFVKLNGPTKQKDLAFEQFKSLIKSMSVK